MVSLPSTIANVTEVLLNSSPFITGSLTYIPAILTSQSSGVKAVTYTSLKTSDGSIVPTASLDGDEGEEEGIANRGYYSLFQSW
jgi:hypothetical protein